MLTESTLCPAFHISRTSCTDRPPGSRRGVDAGRHEVVAQPRIVHARGARGGRRAVRLILTAITADASPSRPVRSVEDPRVDRARSAHNAKRDGLDCIAGGKLAEVEVCSHTHRRSGKGPTTGSSSSSPRWVSRSPRKLHGCRDVWPREDGDLRSPRPLPIMAFVLPLCSRPVAVITHSCPYSVADWNALWRMLRSSTSIPRDGDARSSGPRPAAGPRSSCRFPIQENRSS